MIKILRTLLNVRTVITLMFMVMLKKEIFVISLENIEILCIEIVITMANPKIFVIFHNLKKL